MPMYQGNYVAPVWINNMAPAINDTELLAISQTLAESQILTGSGAPTQYTAGKTGQRYADTSTSPYTIYKLTAAAEDANVWEVDDANGNLAMDYSSESTYTALDYCIHEGLLYKANAAITTPEAWTAAHWTRVYLANELAALALQTGINRNSISAIEAKLPSAASITFSGTWTGASSPYTQTVTVTGVTVTANSQIELLPTAAQLGSLITDGVTALTIENNAGTLTAYALGAAPSAAMTIACNVLEVGT